MNDAKSCGVNASKTDIAKVLLEAGSVLVIGHVSPDGDCCGSVSALAEALSNGAKKVTAAFDAPLPHKYEFLSEYTDFYTAQTLPEEDFDVAIAVDVADMERMGALAQAFVKADKTLCVDHHVSNTRFADLNWIAKRSAVGEMVFEIIEAMGVSVTESMANALYTAINTDTGNFSYNNTDAACLATASRLAAYGADIPWLMKSIYGRRTLGATKLIGTALNTLKLYENGKIALIYVTQKDIADCGAKSEDCDQLVNYTRDIEGVEVGILIRETPYGEYKISFRSNEYADVGAAAQKFDGGGHKFAAGGKSGLELERVIDLVVEEVRKII